MAGQTFDFYDYLGPLAVALVFALTLFIFSIIFNFLLIKKEDDRTVFEKFGSTFDLRCGIHRMRHRPNESRKQQPLLTNDA